jgi:flagella basal body P-ring formation protein FlgA
VAAAAGDAEVTCLKLRAETTVYGDAVRLADVLAPVGGETKLLDQIGSEPVVAKTGTSPLAIVSHEQILKRLEELGVNLARVLIGGALTCRVTLRSIPPAGEIALAADAELSPLRRAPAATEESAGHTLADAVRKYVNGELKALGGTAEVKFERAGQEFLQLTTPPWEFHVSSTGTVAADPRVGRRSPADSRWPTKDKLGLRNFRVLIRRAGEVQRKVEVFAQIRLVRPVVVARKPLNPGNVVRPDDVGVETRVFEQAVGLGFGETAAVIGQQVKKFVPVGELIPSEALKTGELVVRSRPVTVIGDNASVQVRLSGVALDSGGYGDTVRVRLGDARRDRKILQGTVTGVGTVRLAGGTP